MQLELPLNTRAVIVQILAFGPAYGVGLIQKVDELTGVRLSQGSIYPALATLEGDGLIRRRPPLRTARDVEEGRTTVQATAARTLYYELTGDGKRFAKGQQAMILGLLGKPKRSKRRQRAKPSVAKGSAV